MATDSEESNSGTPDSGTRPEVYDEFESFVRKGVLDYYARGWKNRKGNFIALLLASGQILGMAGDSIKDGSGLKKAALGAAGVVALRVALRTFLGGPLGLVLSAAAIASAIGYLLKNQREVSSKVAPYRALIDETRVRFDEIQGGHRANKYDTAARNLMVEGLLKRFLDQADEI